MVALRRPGVRLRHASLGATATVIPLAALVLIPTVLVAGLLVGIPPSGGSLPGISGGGGISVTIRASICLNVNPIRPGVFCDQEPLTLVLGAQATGGGSPYTFLWSFGDGSPPAIGQVLDHTFPDCRDYTVTVVALDQMGMGSNSTALTACPLPV